MKNFLEVVEEIKSIISAEFSDKKIFETTVSEKWLFKDKIGDHVIKGYPLTSIQYDIETGKNKAMLTTMENIIIKKKRDNEYLEFLNGVLNSLKSD